jgi:hypothetical protein
MTANKIFNFCKRCRWTGRLYHYWH